jgi:hypothetical protein
MCRQRRPAPGRVRQSPGKKQPRRALWRSGMAVPNGEETCRPGPEPSRSATGSSRAGIPRTRALAKAIARKPTPSSSSPPPTRRASRWRCPTCWPTRVTPPTPCAPTPRSPCGSSITPPRSPGLTWTRRAPCPVSTPPSSRSSPRTRRRPASSPGPWREFPRSRSRRGWLPRYPAAPGAQPGGAA